MNAVLAAFLDEQGDISFPHAPATAEALLGLFRATRDDATAVTQRLVELFHHDPGFAFNLARLLHEEGMPLDAMPRIALRPCIERCNAFRIVSVLGPLETWAEAFAARRRLGAAYAGVCARAVGAAGVGLASPRLEASDRDLALCLAFAPALGLLGLANLAEERALAVLAAGPAANAVCERTLGFPLAEFSQALHRRYALPDAGNVAYAAPLRELARRAWRSAGADGLGGDGTELAGGRAQTG